MSDKPYKLVIEDNYFYVDGPDLSLINLDRFVHPPVGVHGEYSKRSAQRIIDMLNTAFKAGKKDKQQELPSIIEDGW
jgi:hypothetical protein